MICRYFLKRTIYKLEQYSLVIYLKQPVMKKYKFIINIKHSQREIANDVMENGILIRVSSRNE
jgi:hypothetical protein